MAGKAWQKGECVESPEFTLLGIEGKARITIWWGELKKGCQKLKTTIPVAATVSNSRDHSRRVMKYTSTNCVKWEL
eukprot:162017-Amphidinium_carterae.1